MCCTFSPVSSQQKQEKLYLSPGIRVLTCPFTKTGTEQQVLALQLQASIIHRLFSFVTSWNNTKLSPDDETTVQKTRLLYSPLYKQVLCKVSLLLLRLNFTRGQMDQHCSVKCRDFPRIWSQRVSVTEVWNNNKSKKEDSQLNKI